MNLAELIAELATIIADKSLEPYFKGWINQALVELAADFDLPALRLLNPHPLPVTTAGWLFDLPEAFQKNLFQARNGAYDKVTIYRDMASLDARDIRHTETGLRVAGVCVVDRKIGVWPRADDTLYLWFFRNPEVLDSPDDRVVCIPPEFQVRVIIPKVVIKNFKLLQDLMLEPPHQSLLWWQEEYRNGLFGSLRGDTGFIGYLNRARPPRRHGGRDPLP